MNIDKIIAKWNNLSPQERNAWIAEKVMNVDTRLFNFAHDAGNYNYSTDISKVWELEEHIKSIGLADEYGFQIYLITEAGETENNIRNINVFKIVHATPEQRCLAAILAIEDGEQG